MWENIGCLVGYISVCKALCRGTGGVRWESPTPLRGSLFLTMVYLWWRFAYHRLCMYRRLFRLRYDRATRVSIDVGSRMHHGTALRSGGYIGNMYRRLFRIRYDHATRVSLAWVHGVPPAGVVL